MSTPYLGNIAFWVSDFEKSEEFYCDLIGLEPLASGEVPRKWIFFGNDRFNFSINQRDADASTEDSAGWAKCPMNPSLNETWAPYFTVYVSDLEEIIARCRKAEVRVKGDKPFSLGEGFGISQEVMDPDGITIALTQKETE